jgi:hypothetical protein
MKRAPKLSSMVLRTSPGISFMSCLSTYFKRRSRSIMLRMIAVP